MTPPDMPNNGPRRIGLQPVSEKLGAADNGADQPGRRIGVQSVSEKLGAPDNGADQLPENDRLKTYPTYWRSLEQLADTPQFRAALERQPALGAEQALHASRRRFLQTMGASLGLAGLAGTGCIRLPEEKLAPYAHRPENRTPGTPVSYATAMETGGVAQGLLVTSYDGRPIKIEGNPTHPLNRGAADQFAQASVLELYDPDRSRGVIKNTLHRGRGGDGPEDKPEIAVKAASWDDFKSEFIKQIPADGTGFCVLSEASNSPSFVALRAKFQEKFPKAQWYEYEAISDDNVRVGTFAAFGQHVLPVLDLAKAKVIVSLDADLFGDGSPLAVKYARDFAAGRRLHDKTTQKEMNRLYVIESLHTITGASADYRLARRPSEIAAIAKELTAVLGVAGVDAAGDSKLPLLDSIITDLQKHKGQAVVVAGSRQPPEVHALVAAINYELGNVGRTVVYYPDPQPKRPSHAGDLAHLVKQMEAGGVSSLLILGGNPAHNAPADLKFAEALKKVPQAVHLAAYEDETSRLCAWHLPRAHYLESWGDVRTFDGTPSVVQPLIEPLFDGRSAIEVLSMIVDEKPWGGYDIVRGTVKGLVGDSFTEYRWKKLLADGAIEGTAWKPVEIRSLAHWVRQPVSTTGEVKDEYELVFYADKLYDGRFANNGWLQELPDPMTRLTWDNAAVMSKNTADKIGVKQDELVELSAEGAKVLAPVFFLPGVADGVIGLALGYGRTAAGHVGNNVGQNAYALRTTAALGWRTVKAQPTGKKYPLATVQDHHIVDDYGKQAVKERIPELLHEVSLAKAYEGVRGKPPMSIFDAHKFDGTSPPSGDQSHVPKHDLHKWGMAIDLTSCTGCGACVVACQAENNIPIVGKEQVLHGREMHWIRIDRYFRDSPDDPMAVHQPVLCMQCENAPCESVCPVAATTHSQEGLNMMTYNRCVGTRYCSNNCPYKVRRFNFFDYNRGTLTDHYVPNQLRQPISELVQMQKNPEVSVRMRGVMEKCTYCIQRIEQARIAAKREGDRAIRDGEIQTACQQTCPAQAIVFGDLNDPESRAAKLHALPRTYGMLDPELNTKPRTQYIARVRNSGELRT
jgi:molybdopterin-containing oxidoreductase family iron-sulfur binding subunit